MRLPRPVGAVLAAAVSLGGCSLAPGAPAETHPLESVVDGDTIRVIIDGGSHRVRILGIDAPEVDPPEPCAAEAAAHLEQLLNGKPVTLIRSTQAPDRDRYDRILAYVETDAADVGRSLLEAGLAEPYRSQDHDRREQYERAHARAEAPPCAR